MFLAVFSRPLGMVGLELVQSNGCTWNAKTFCRATFTWLTICLGTPFQSLLVELVIVRLDQCSHLCFEIRFPHPLVNGSLFDHQSIIQRDANRVVRLRWRLNIFQVFHCLLEVWEPFQLEMAIACQVEGFVGNDRGTKVGLVRCMGNCRHSHFLSWSCISCPRKKPDLLKRIPNFVEVFFILTCKHFRMALEKTLRFERKHTIFKLSMRGRQQSDQQRECQAIHRSPTNPAPPSRAWKSCLVAKLQWC